jgi:aldehyde:ferredoxin oxidoreductase
MRPGYASIGSLGKILNVDLSNKEWSGEEIGLEIIKRFMGGMGLSAKVLFEETGPEIEPLSPRNVVIVSAGLLNGTDAPTAYRAEIITKSPLTGTIGGGNFGGLFGSRMRKAGFESIVFEGKSPHPVYLKIDNDQIELKNASHLWSRDTWETTDALRKEEGEDFSIMAIGPAGENLVRFACPIVDYYHAPGRSHAGCVMGSKNLKAIAVRGTKKIKIASPEMFMKTKKEIEARVKEYPERGLRLKVGSTGTVVYTAKKGGVGGKNYQTGILSESNEIWRPEGFTKYLTKGPVFCGGCLLSNYYGCNVTIDVKEGQYRGLYLEGAGYSHPVWNWGAKCAIESFPAMLKCKEMCNRYGMDQMGPIPFALELYQRGIITKEDNDGMELEWGEVDAVLDLLRKIAYRQGLGNIFAEGSERAGEIIGGEAKKYAFPVKGMELMSGGDPRDIGMATILGHLTNIRGGDDLKTTHTVVEGMPGWAKQQGMSEEEYLKWLLGRLDMPESMKSKIYGVPPSLRISTKNWESLALITKWYEDMAAVRDALGICLFAVNYTSTIGPSYSSRLLSAYLGINVTSEEIMAAGERILNLMKAYNVREGLTRIHDDLPSRFYDETLQNGSQNGPVL